MAHICHRNTTSSKHLLRTWDFFNCYTIFLIAISPVVGTFIIFNVLMRKQRHREVDGFFPKSSSYSVAEFLSSEYESCPEESRVRFSKL